MRATLDHDISSARIAWRAVKSLRVSTAGRRRYADLPSRGVGFAKEFVASSFGKPAICVGFHPGADFIRFLDLLFHGPGCWQAAKARCDGGVQPLIQAHRILARPLLLQAKSYRRSHIPAHHAAARPSFHLAGALGFIRPNSVSTSSECSATE